MYGKRLPERERENSKCKSSEMRMFWMSYRPAGASVAIVQWGQEKELERYQGLGYSVFEAITGTMDFILWVLRKPWKIKSRRETKSDIVLKGYTVHCMDAGRLVGRQWQGQAGDDGGWKSWDARYIFRAESTGLLIDWMWSIRGRKESKMIPVFWPRNCNVCRRGYRIKSSFAKFEMPFRPPNTNTNQCRQFGVL